MNDMDAAITHCLERTSTAYEARDAKEWALAAAVLIDKYTMPRPVAKEEEPS